MSKNKKPCPHCGYVPPNKNKYTIHTRVCASLPDAATLAEMARTKSVRQIALQFGVYGDQVRKRIKDHVGEDGYKELVKQAKEYQKGKHGVPINNGERCTRCKILLSFEAGDGERCNTCLTGTHDKRLDRHDWLEAAYGETRLT